MYGLKVSSLLALAIALPQALATPPACLLACVSQVQKQSSCDSLGDYSCLCSAEFSAVNTCLENICPNGNADAAKAAFLSTCGSRASSASSSSTKSSSSSSSSSSVATSSSSSAAPASSASSTAAATTSSSSSAVVASSSSSKAQASSTTTIASSSSSTVAPSVSFTAGANDVGKSFGAAAVIGLVGALL